MLTRMPTLLDVDDLPPLLERTIPAAWEDLNGHVNVRHYLELYDQAGWPMLGTIGIEERHFREERRGLFDLEHHIWYRRRCTSAWRPCTALAGAQHRAFTASCSWLTHSTVRRKRVRVRHHGRRPRGSLDGAAARDRRGATGRDHRRSRTFALAGPGLRSDIGLERRERPCVHSW
jgi:hypothetical protein